MTQRPEAHKTEGKSVRAVLDVIFNAGHAPEEITHDYGEDLLVQTSHKDQMDASRLWFQVKGTADVESHRLKNGGLRYSISFDHALRWRRSLDLVVFVLWDVVNRVGWYAIPQDQIDTYEGVASMKKSVTLHIDEEDLFTEEAVDTLAWRSRLEHYRLLVLSAWDTESDLDEEEARSKERDLIALDFADLIKVTERRTTADGVLYRPRPEVWDEFMGILFSRPPGRNPQEEERNLHAAAYATVYQRWKMIEPKLDLPNALIEETGKILLDRLEGEMGVKDLPEATKKLLSEEMQGAPEPGEEP